MKSLHHPIRRRSVLQSLGAVAAASAVGLPLVAKAATPVKIGLLTPLSGPLAFPGQTTQNCLKLAVRELNAAGGILGRPVELVAEDSQMSTAVSVDKARKLVSSDEVSLITGMILPAEREAALQAAGPAKRLVLFPNFDEGRCHASLLSTALQPPQTIDPLVEWLSANVGKRVYIVSSDLASLKTISIPRIKAGFERAGGSVLATQFFPFGTRDFGPVLQQIKSAEPDIVWHYIGDDPAAFIRQYRSFGLKPQLVSEIANEPLNVATAGAATGSIGVSSYFMSLANDANRKFLDDYTAEYKNFTDRRVRDKVTIHPVGEASYVGLKLFAEAARLADSLEFDKVKAAFKAVTLNLPRGQVKVDAAGGHTVSPTYIGRVAPDNSFELLATRGPITPACL